MFQKFLPLFIVAMFCSVFANAQGSPCLDIDVTTTDILCANSGDGSITITPTNGVPPYNADVNGASTGPFNSSITIGNLVDGVYNVFVSDSDTCFTTADIVITSPSEIFINLEITGVTCSGDGVIAAIVNGGTGAYSFQWSNGSTTEAIFGLSAGVYSLTVTDANACTNVATAVITEPSAMVVTFDIQEPTSAGNDGIITAIISGGTAPYLFEWSTGAVTSTIDGLSPGDYSLTVTDANGCTVVSPAIHLENSIINATVINVDCNGEATGSIEIEVLTGVAPYTFVWAGPNGYISTNKNIDNLQAGSYTLEITDANNDVFTVSVVVLENPELVIDVAFSPLCAGEPIVANVTVSGGVPPYTFDWGGLDPNDLPAGPFTITITDAVNCSIVHDDVATAPDPMVLTTTVTDPLCGNADGCIMVDVTGGTAPYTYVWINGNSSQTICGLAEGTYAVTVVDANGCAATIAVALVDIGGPEVTVMNSQAVCYNEGFINLQVTGVAPFIFAWSDDPSITTQNRTDLEAGTYTATITDAQGCSMIVTIFIDFSILLEMESTPADCDSTGGTATATVTGGAASPVYLWSNGETNATITDLAPGGYSVTVTDPGPGCRRHENVIVELDSACFVTIAGTVYLEELNTDCIPDNGAGVVGGLMVGLDNNIFTFTDNQGNYSFNVEPGTYELALVDNNPQYAALCAGPVTIDVSNAMDVSDGNDFFVEYGIDKDLKIYVNKGNARPGFIQSIQICVWNFGSAAASGTLTFVHDPIQEFLSANPTETTYDMNTQTITWDFVNLAPGAVAIFRPRVKLAPSVPIGTNLNLNFEVTPIAGDLTPWNNTIHCPMVVTGSYDPNDKAVTPGTGEDGTIYAMDTLLTYRVRFQNTGTDTAFTVVVKDQLEANLDIETVIPGPSSHDYTLTVESPRTLVFTFNNIMLPDSFVNEPASNGFVFFDIRPIEGTGFGTVIENTAGIYFDFNPPVITNTTTTTFDQFVSTISPEEFSLPLAVQPNPSSGAVTLSYGLEEAQTVWINVYNIQGRLINRIQKPRKMSAGKHQLRISGDQLAEGVYWIQIQTSKDLRGFTKLIKM